MNRRDSCSLSLPALLALDSTSFRKRLERRLYLWSWLDKDPCVHMLLVCPPNGIVLKFSDLMVMCQFLCQVLFLSPRPSPGPLAYTMLCPLPCSFLPSSGLHIPLRVSPDHSVRVATCPVHSLLMLLDLKSGWFNRHIFSG